MKTLERGLRFAASGDDSTAKTTTSDKTVKGIDQALGEGRGRKRGNENGRGNDRKKSRGAGNNARQVTGSQPAKKQGSGVLNDPVEKAKAEARAKKFGTS